MTFHPSRSGLDRQPGGFSLIELIGVLAILAILASVTTESLMSRMSESRRQAEMVELARLVGCMEKLVRQDHRLPASSDWPAAIASGFATPVANIGTHFDGAPRLWVPDPAWKLAGRGPATAYRQDAYGTPRPEGIRMLIVSAPKDTELGPDGSGFGIWWENPSGDSGSRALWNGVVSTDAIPMERIGFEPLFHRVILNNRSTGLTARWAVDGIEDVGSCSPGHRHEAYYIETSRLLLLDSSGEIQETVLIEGSCSWVFESGRWHRRLGPGSDLVTTDRIRSVFELKSLPAFRGVEPGELVDAMYDLMGAHVRWAADGFRRSAAMSPMVPSHRRLTEAARRLMDLSDHFLQP